MKRWWPLLMIGCLPPRIPAENRLLSAHVDAVLGPRQHDDPAGIVLGPSGKRLRCERIEARPGMRGKFRVPGWEGSLFELSLFDQGRAILFPPLSHQWWPSHVGMEGRADGLRLVERKFITRDDQAVDLVQLANEGTEPRTLTLNILDRCEVPHSLVAGERIVSLKPAENLLFPVVLSFGGAPADRGVEEILEDHLAEYNDWFEKSIPDFDCSDPWFAKLWYYRWYVVRRALDEPDPDDPILRWLRFSERRWLRGAAVAPVLRPALPDVPVLDAPFPARTKPGGSESRLSTNALFVDALADAVRTRRATRRGFFDFLQRYVRSQYASGDFARPVVGEVLDCESGTWMSPDRDVLLSSYADLLIRHVGGLTPRDDETLEFFPIVDAFSRFRFRNVPYRGALLEIAWDSRRGFTVLRDGKTLFTLPDLRHVAWKEREGVTFLE